MPVPPIDPQPPPTITQSAQEQNIPVGASGQIYLDGKPVKVEELKARLTENKNTSDRTAPGHGKK